MVDGDGRETKIASTLVYICVSKHVVDGESGFNSPTFQDDREHVVRREALFSSYVNVFKCGFGNSLSGGNTKPPACWSLRWLGESQGKEAGRGRTSKVAIHPI